MSSPTKILIIDGNALVHRGFHALPPLTDSRGRMVNAVYGFALSMLRAWKEIKPTHIVATFDLKGPTFRDEMYAEYKATRVVAPDELYEQLPIVKEFVRSFNVPIYEQAGFEADDVIGTIVKQAPEAEKIILTGDMDTMQLVDKKTKVYTMRKGLSDTMLYDERGVKERYGLRPDQVIDYKALRGDPSDNIPGVKGIGEKTATDLLQTFGTLEKLYDELEQESNKALKIKPAVREKLVAHKKEALLSQKLATIHQDVPVKFNIDEAAVRNYDREKVVTMLQVLDFKSLLNKLPDVATSSIETVSPKAKQAAMVLRMNAPAPKREGQVYILANDDAVWAKFIAALTAQKIFSVDTEATGLDPVTAKLLGISFSWQAGEAWYVPVDKERLAALKPVLENPAVEKIGHNMKFDAALLENHGIKLRPLSFDTMLASYLLNPGTRQHNLDAVVFTELGYEMMPIAALIGPRGKNQIPMESVSLEKLSWYSCEDADFTWRLYQQFLPKLGQAALTGVMEKIEMPLVPVLMDMELAGIKIDTEFLGEMGKKVRVSLKKTEQAIYKLAGQEFNINSPLQLKEILFDKLNISTEGLGRTKTGVSTSADELEKLKNAHEIIPLIKQQREMQKLLSTYIEALPAMVNEKTSRVHTSFNQAVTATGRLSSSEPNLQNIPIRTELGAEIRKAFIAERGFRLISADYSQIELRIAASMAKDKAMMDSFNKHEDIHARTAAEINGVTLDKVTATMRRAAKAVNFGILYGLGYVGLAQNEGIPREEAKAFIEKYFAIYKNIKLWIEQTKAQAHELGYVETLLGRRRYFPEINSTNQGLAAQAERMAANTPIQGTAADLLKLAMIKLHAEMPKISPKSRLLLQVHDELVLETPTEETEKVAKFLKETMENIYKLNVPIEVSVGIGKNWGEAK